MDEDYDIIIFGTGLKECILSGILTTEKYKVLHVDRNGYYGGDCASLNLEQLFAKFRGEGAIPSADLGANRDYNVDQIPKFIMASGLLVKMLLKTNVARYIEFKSVDGGYVYKNGKIHKVPATDTEAMKGSLMGFFEKMRAIKFFQYLQNWDEKNPKTHKGVDIHKVTMTELYQKFGLDKSTIEFIGHGLALHRDDDYLTQPAYDTCQRISLYSESLARYSNSPFIYPLYGLGELPQGFSRLAAIYGGTYMLNAPIDKFVYTDNKVTGVKSTEGTQANCKFVIADPSYFPEKCKKTGQVIRAICMMTQPLANTKNSDSCQIIIPQDQLNRKSDIYICVTSYANCVSPKGIWLGIVAATVETNDPEKEIEPGLKLFGDIKEKFVQVYDTYEPLQSGKDDNVYISKSYDATTHFETTCLDIMDMYKRITGKDLDLDINPEDINDE